MCGIAGFCNMKADYTKEREHYEAILDRMKQAQKHRGPDDDGDILYPQTGFAHTRLSIVDLTRGHQPMTGYQYGNAYTIVYNGELYNTSELREHLIHMGYSFRTHTDTEVILTGFIAHGVEFVKELNGIFSFAIWDDNSKALYLVRDRLGVKPLFYTVFEHTLIFASEIKALFQYPGFAPRVDKNGLCEIFGLGPAKSYGLGVFKDVYEVLPGHYLA